MKKQQAEPWVSANSNEAAWLLDLANNEFQLSVETSGTNVRLTIFRVGSEDDVQPTVFEGPDFLTALARAHRWVMFDLPNQSKQLPLERIFSEVVNANSLENESNTPDFLLGEWLADSLARLNSLIRARDKWYGVKLEPGVHRCREYDWEHGERVTINVGAIFKIGKRLWRLMELPGEEQGKDHWRFESTEIQEYREGFPAERLFTRSELQWLYSHGAFVGHPVDAEGAVL